MNETEAAECERLRQGQELGKLVYELWFSCLEAKSGEDFSSRIVVPIFLDYLSSRMQLGIKSDQEFDTSLKGPSGLLF